MERDRVEAVVGMWGQRVLAVDVPTTGTMNETVIVTTPRERVVLRGHRQPGPRQVAFEHDVIGHAGDAGLPTPAAIPTPDGRRFVEHEGRLYSLFRHARGHQVARDQVREAHAAAMGRALGRLHAIFDGFRHPDARRARHHRDVPEVLARIDRLLAHLDALDRPRPEDRWARERLAGRAAWLADVSSLPAPSDGPEQLVHGDYQDSNLFFENGEVTGIIDWDKAELQSPGEEILRSMHLSLLLDVPKCRAFLAGYREVTAMPTEELHRAAVTYSHDRACDLWLYETIYLDGNDRVSRFLTAGEFSPFLDLWNPLEPSIVG